jgi:hypothetical protein
MEKPPLKPCPFDGAEAQYRTEIHPAMLHLYVICKTCQLRTWPRVRGEKDNDPDIWQQCADDWNNRANEKE